MKENIAYINVRAQGQTLGRVALPAGRSDRIYPEIICRETGKQVRLEIEFCRDAEGALRPSRLKRVLKAIGRVVNEAIS